MSRERKQKMLLYAALLVVLLAAAMFMNRSVVKIDICLDEGGAWDDLNKVCSTDCARTGGVWDGEQKLCAALSGDN